MECVGNRFRPHMMHTVYHIILDMSIFVEACKKNRKNFYAYQKFQHIEYRTSERRKKMKIVEDTISKIFIYQNDNAEYINNICIGYQQKHIVTYHYDSEKEKSIHKKQVNNPRPM